MTFLHEKLIIHTYIVVTFTFGLAVNATRENTLLRIFYTGNYRDRVIEIFRNAIRKLPPLHDAGEDVSTAREIDLPGECNQYAPDFPVARVDTSRTIFRATRKNHILHIHRNCFLIQSENYLQRKETCHTI